MASTFRKSLRSISLLRRTMVLPPTRSWPSGRSFSALPCSTSTRNPWVSLSPLSLDLNRFHFFFGNEPKSQKMIGFVLDNRKTSPIFLCFLINFSCCRGDQDQEIFNYTSWLLHNRFSLIKIFGSDFPYIIFIFIVFVWVQGRIIHADSRPSKFFIFYFFSSTFKNFTVSLFYRIKNWLLLYNC